MTKKIYDMPDMRILHIGKEIVTQDVISASIHSGTTSTYYAPGQRGFDDWDAGY